MFGMFNKKKEEETPEEVQAEVNEQIIDIVEPKVDLVEVKKNKKEDFITTQCLAIGEDVKNEVETFSKVFFRSKNVEKAKAYAALHHYLVSMDDSEKYKIKNMTYLDFKEKEEQLLNKLRGGLAQFLSKGSNLNEELKRTIDLVFSDIKKLPSKGHRYWYYKIYIWQELGTED